MQRYSALVLVVLLTGCHSLTAPGKLGRQPINVSGQVISSTPVRHLPAAGSSRTSPVQSEIRIPVNAVTQEAGPADAFAEYSPPYPAPPAQPTGKRQFQILYPVGGTRFAPEPGVARDLNEMARTARRIDVLARTDADKASAADEAVALKRAIGAREYLVRIGADPKRVFLQYLSAGDYVGDNTTTFGRSQNRRVEVHIE